MDLRMNERDMDRGHRADHITTSRSGLPGVLDDGEDVPFGVLEPGGLRAAPGDDAVDRLETGRVVFLEGHAPRFEFRDGPLDVLDLPECLAGAVGAGVRGRVEEGCGSVRELVGDAAGDLFRWMEPKRLFVER